MKVTVFAITLFVLSFGGFVFGRPPTDNNDSGVCVTETCVHTASRILKMRNSNVNPCDDFYEFACGGFSNYTQSTDDSIEKSILDKIHNKYYKNIKRKLEEPIAKDDFKYMKLAKTLYKICKNEKSIDHIDDLFEIGEGWPLFEGSQWNESSFDFNKTIFKTDNTTQWINYFFGIYLNQNYSSIIVEPDESIFGSFSKYDYYKHMIGTAKEIQVSDYNTNYVSEIADITEFEYELSSSRLTEEQTSNSTFDTIEITLDELTKNYSFFNWQEYISYHRGSPVDPSTIITIKNLSYMKKLNSLLNSTEIRTIANYVIWKHIQRNLEFNNYLHDIKCDKIVSEKLEIAMGAIFIQNYDYSLSINTEKNIEKMFSNIKESVLEFIKKADWIDDESKNIIIKKIQSTYDVAGYITKFTNHSLIDDYYKDLELYENDSVFDVIARFDQFEQKNWLTINNETTWTILGPLMIDNFAFFLERLNAIVISYKILQGDAYDFEKPNYLNYGALGFIIGHEITHAFDHITMNIDSNDLLKSISVQNFNEKSRCLINQYGKYGIPLYHKKLNGNISQHENLADNSGIRVAYEAYNKLSGTPDKRLPGLSYTPRQMFWISYGNLWCEHSPLAVMASEMDDIHPPSKFRVLGTLSNSREFAEDFNCPQGSNMNPIEKCSIW